MPERREKQGVEEVKEVQEPERESTTQSGEVMRRIWRLILSSGYWDINWKRLEDARGQRQQSWVGVTSEGEKEDFQGASFEGLIAKGKKEQEVDINGTTETKENHQLRRHSNSSPISDTMQ